MDFGAFFQEYFVTPLYVESAGYNIYNTAVYGIILALAVFGLYKVLQRMKVPIDWRFFAATIPFMVLAPVLRVLRDANVLTSPAFVSPLIYILVFAVTFTALLGSLALEKLAKVPYYILMSTAGVFLVLFYSINLSFSNLVAGAQILSLTAVFAGIFILMQKYKPEMFTSMNIVVLTAAMFDACSTFIGVTYYGYVEKHVLPHFLIDLVGGAWVMIPLKLAVILLALWVIDSTEEDSFFKNFLKFAILAVTLGPGARNTLRIVMAT
jgi:uncharacterized membrane protein